MTCIMLYLEEVPVDERRHFPDLRLMPCACARPCLQCEAVLGEVSLGHCSDNLCLVGNLSAVDGIPACRCLCKIALHTKDTHFSFVK